VAAEARHATALAPAIPTGQRSTVDRASALRYGRRVRPTSLAATTVVFAALTLVWLHPLLPALSTGYLAPIDAPGPRDGRDVFVTMWTLAWSSHALLTDPLRLFDANVFHPLRMTLAFFDPRPASTLLVLPVHVLLGDPIVDYNWLVAASFVLSGLGAALLVHELGWSVPAAWLAGALVAFNPLRAAAIGDANALTTHWMPFAFFAILRCLHRGRGALLVAATGALVALSGVGDAGPFFAVAIGLLVAHRALGAAAAPGGRRRAAAGLAAAGAVGIAMLAPYALVRRVYALPTPALSAHVAAIGMLAGAVLAAAGAEALWRRTHRWRPLALVPMVAVAAVSFWPPQVEVRTVSWAGYDEPPVYDWLDRLGGRDAIVELPIGRPANDASSMVLSANHWRPLVNGYGVVEPAMPFFRRFLTAFPDAATQRLLREIGVRWVVVHAADPSTPENPLCGLVRAPQMSLAYRDGRTCVFELAMLSPRTPPADRSLSLGGTVVTSSDASDATGVLDGDVATEWQQVVDPSSDGWLQLDFPAPRMISRLVLQLGPHFGEYLRQWRLDVCNDGTTWVTVASERNAVPPLTGMRTDPDRLAIELRLPRPIATRRLRIVRPAAEPGRDLDLWAGWRVWGAHEVELYEPLPVAAPAGAG
jgi:hypothetical protein